MSKAAELAKAGETLTNQPSGRKNLVTNGAMQIAQRTTSATGLGGAAAYGSVDRFIIEAGHTAGRLTMAQVADGPSGFANCVQLSCTTADTSIATEEYLIFSQRFEGQDLQQLKKGTSDAESVTVSFYVKGNASATYTLELKDNDNGQFNSQEFSVTTDWVKITKTFVGDTAGAFGDDNALSLKLNFWLHAGSQYTGGTHVSNTWGSTVNTRVGDNQTSFVDSTDRTLFLTGVQIEIGSQATPFEHRSFGEELALCSRYYTDVVRADDKTAHLIGYVQTAAVARYSFHVPMRAAPTITETNFVVMHGGGSEEAITSVDDISKDNQLVSFRANVSANLTAGQAVALFSAGAATLTFDSEL